MLKAVRPTNGSDKGMKQELTFDMDRLLHSMQDLIIQARTKR